MESIDGIIMGRKTFEKLLTFDEWPYAKKELCTQQHSSGILEGMRMYSL